MAIQAALTSQDRELGRKRYLWFCRLNGFAFTCIGDNVLILYALKLGMPEYLLGFFTSFLYLTLPMILLGRTAMARHGSTKVMGWAWACRHMFAVLLILSPWMPFEWLTLAAILAAWFGFCSCRAFGLVGFSPLVGDITDTTNRGKFSSSIFLWFNLAILISMTFVIVLTRISVAISMYQGIIGVGVVTGLLSSWYIMRVPESEAPRRSANRPIVRSMQELWQTPRFRRLVSANAAGSLAIVLIAPLSMAALKRGYGVSDDVALLFAILQILGGISISLLSGIISDHSGPRPLIILYGFGMFLVCFFWAICPVDLYAPYVLGIFAILGAASMGTLLSFSHYFLLAVKDEDRVSASIVTNIVVGLAAGLLGSVVSAGLIRSLQSFGYEGLPMYRAYFMAIGVIVLIVIGLHLRLQSLEDWRVSKVLGLMFSPRDLRALLTISRISAVSTPEQDSRHVDKLATSTSGLSADALVDYLDSPDFSVRGRALHAISDATLTEPVRDVLLRELTEGEHTTAYMAAQALGEYRVREAIPALRHALTSADYYLSGKAMVALVRLEDTETYPTIRTKFTTTENVRILIHGARAIADMGDTASIPLILERAAQADLPSTVHHELLYHAARLASCGDAFYLFLKAYRKNPNEALQDLGITPEAARATIADKLPASLATRDDLTTECIICLWHIHRPSSPE